MEEKTVKMQARIKLVIENSFSLHTVDATIAILQLSTASIARLLANPDGVFRDEDKVVVSELDAEGSGPFINYVSDVLPTPDAIIRDPENSIRAFFAGNAPTDSELASLREAYGIPLAEKRSYEITLRRAISQTVHTMSRAKNRREAIDRCVAREDLDKRFESPLGEETGDPYIVAVSISPKPNSSSRPRPHG